MELLDLANSDHRLCTDRLRLRPLTTADCGDHYVDWLADPDVNGFLETRWQEQSSERIAEFVAAANESTDSALFGIVVKDTGSHIGNIKLGPVNRRHSCADVSYFIGDRDSWGRGYATEAVRAVTDYGFRTIGLHRIQAGVYSTNVASARVLERVGFRAEGVWRQQLVGPDGEWVDHSWFGLLADEFRA